MPSQGSEKNLQSALGSGSEGKNLISHSILYCSSFFIVLFYSNSPVPLLASPSVFFPLHPSLKKKPLFSEALKGERNYRSYLSLVKSTLLEQALRSWAIYYGNIRIQGYGTKTVTWGQGYSAHWDELWDVGPLLADWEAENWHAFLRVLCVVILVDICGSDLVYNSKVLNLSIYKKAFSLAWTCSKVRVS